MEQVVLAEELERVAAKTMVGEVEVMGVYSVVLSCGGVEGIGEKNPPRRTATIACEFHPPFPYTSHNPLSAHLHMPRRSPRSPSVQDCQRRCWRVAPIVPSSPANVPTGKSPPLPTLLHCVSPALGVTRHRSVGGCACRRQRRGGVQQCRQG